MTITGPVLTKSQLEAQYKAQVDAASIKLIETTSNTYWDKEVTQASTLGKILGFIKYCVMHNRLTEYLTGDSAKDATALEYVNKATALINALAARNLSIEETAKCSTIAGKITITPQQFAQSTEANRKAEDAEKDFYEIFKKRCAHLSVTDSNNYAIYHAGAMRGLSVSAEAFFPEDKAAMNLKLETLNQRGQGRVFNDIIETFAKQPATSITLESYKKLVTDLDPSTNRFCANMTETEIATKLRQAIKAEHTGTVLADLATKYADTTSTEYTALQSGLRTKLDAEKVALELELGALCGPHGCDGTVHTKWTALDTARKALVQAEAALTAQFAIDFPGVGVTSSAATIAKLNFDAKPALKAVQDAYNAKVAEVDAAQEAYDAIESKKHELGRWTGDALTGGKVYNAQIKAGAGFNIAVTNAATKLADFYTELDQSIGSFNKVHRQLLMKTIIG